MPLRLRGGRAPFVAIATFPPFQRGNLPRRWKQGVSLRAERSNLPGGRVFAKYILLTLVMGYFAYAQYDVLFIPYRHFVPLPPKEEAKLHVILNEVKNPTEELTDIYFITLVVGYFACAQYDVLNLRDCRACGSQRHGNSPSREFASSLRFPRKDSKNKPCFLLRGKWIASVA